MSTSDSLTNGLRNVHRYLARKVTPGRVLLERGQVGGAAGAPEGTVPLPRSNSAAAPLPSNNGSPRNNSAAHQRSNSSSLPETTFSDADAIGAASDRIATSRLGGESASARGGEDSPSEAASPPPFVTSAYRSQSDERTKKFQRVLDADVVDLPSLKALAWNGVPPHLRSLCWKLLLGYLPAKRDRRDRDVSRRRHEYRSLVPEYYAIPASQRTEEEHAALRQVAVDAPRTAPEVAFFHDDRMQQSLERLLYIWGVRHPASGYVQGINDLVTPFLAVFLSDHFEGDLSAHPTWAVHTLSETQLLEVEADAYWCLCKLLDGIQDHYTYAQPGIQRTIAKVQELIAQVDAPLVAHLQEQGVELMQFGFRWVNCLLIREIPFDLAIRLWDTYVAEGNGLAAFLPYTCASFLTTWSPKVTAMEFQDIMLFLQKLPTAGWTEQELESVLSQAFIQRATYAGAQTSQYSGR